MKYRAKNDGIEYIYDTNFCFIALVICGGVQILEFQFSGLIWYFHFVSDFATGELLQVPLKQI